MSREAVDHALKTLREDRDRISANLLDLENHHGYRLLKGARLAGPTRRRWDDVTARLTLLWRLFDAYQRILDEAGQVRDRQTRPGEATLRELTALLSGPSVELPLDEVPLERRTLLGPTSERLTLAEAVGRMTAAYDEAIGLISAVDAAWETLLGPLDAAEEEWREAARLARSLAAGRDAELDRIGRELAAAGQLVRTDPLALVRDGRADTARLDAVRADLAKVRDVLVEAVRVREEYDRRVGGIESALTRLGEVLAQARDAYRTVQVKIASPGVDEPADPTPVLRERLAALAGLRDAGRWPELAGRVAALEGAVAAALEQAERSRRLIGGLLERRDELRGRLDAYRVKAARLGFAEHDELTRLQEQARELLWTAPCDLQRSTVVLAQYQRVLRSLETGTD
ncbi:hypothetical protein SAMN04489712_12476 [Thermomonospora echinospora]|uniref:Uncharacterized protein n=1 Tax=Thermomonospora echinospora TaxID=1992 RepID=A0A1H6DX22_9ACTN|nr:hypothetical protein [Thermomonospora echinospora]SEG89818.1 hypothetical protein SAMN04489712_12476 [Thermomonospora echinospora]